MKNSNYLLHLIRLVTLILAQVLILNQLPLGGYILPYVYILFIILLPFETGAGWVMILGLISGLAMDMFSDTIGMHASACVFMAFIRPAAIRLLIPKDDFDSFPQPTLKELGFNRLFTYTLILAFAHHAFLFYVEVFHFTRFFSTLFRSIASTLLTVTIIMLIQYLFSSKKDN